MERRIGYGYRRYIRRGKGRGREECV